MAYGAHREEHFLAGEGPFDERCKRFDDLRNREPPAGELRGGAAVAVGDNFPFAFVDPGRAERQDHPVGRAEARHPPCGRRSCGGAPLRPSGGKVAVESEMEPPLRIVLQLLAPDLRAERPDGRGDRQRIEEDARGVGRNVEPGPCEAVGDM